MALVGVICFLMFVCGAPFVLFFFASGFRYYCLLVLLFALTYRYLTKSELVQWIFFLAGTATLITGWVQFYNRGGNKDKSGANAASEPSHSDSPEPSRPDAPWDDHL